MTPALRSIAAVLLVLGLPWAGLAGDRTADALSLSGEEVKGRLCGRLDGLHFTAKVRMELREPGYEESRELIVWRDDQEHRRERLMAQFQSPADMRGTGVLYIEGVDRPNQYFLYQPSLRRVRRIDERLVTQDVYGVDLEYIGFGVAQLQPVEVESVDVVEVDGRPVYLLTEQATTDTPRFERRRIWVDPDTFIPLRAEHDQGGQTTLVARTVSVREIHGVPTPVETVYERPLEGLVAYMTVDDVDYESPIPDIFFSTLQMTKAR